MLRTSVVKDYVDIQYGLVSTTGHGAYLPLGADSERIGVLDAQVTTLLWQQVERDVIIGDQQREIIDVRAQNAINASSAREYQLQAIAMRNQAAVQASTIHEHENTMHKLRDTLAGRDAEISAAKATQDRMQKEIRTWTEGYHRQTGSLTAAREKALASEAEKDSLRVQLDNALEKMASDRHAVHDRITTLEGQLDNAEDRAQKAQCQATEIDAELDTTRSTISILEGHLDAANRRAEDAERRLAEMVSTITAMGASDHIQTAASADDWTGKMDDEDDGRADMECDKEERGDLSVRSQNESGAVSSADAWSYDPISLGWWLVLIVLLLPFLLLEARAP
ncbi:Tropomyosin alpha-4 chain-like isoform X5 [Lasiodiplodia theobromae]|uniref:Tropomyosin alpha-4 chain-like isoform X5 n=1 Tax=Lasiodiplodia theobromae TaxID=45133 RepID=UPI0015C34D22|nr:Tropomyosin alpha-4 chain-like isoform X5 [Lasiodiplodia theobromae]KAF4538189.1 Tropomyosin alpha-4 chain-like isoform X5 [Lasiodiplodia theobromae]